MTCIVQKYGGSSVADIDKLQKIAHLIADTKKRCRDIAVVVSAMGKTTDELVMMARYLSSKPPRREMDMLLSTGERITMALLCMALHELGHEAVSLTGSQAGIITNDRHNDAQVIEVRPFRIQDEMAEGKVVIVGGFQGVSYKRDITTLGRGGSDTTAVALAAALDAERCEIYSDIDGVYSADPSRIADYRNNMFLLEALELMADRRIPVHGLTTTSFRISLLVPTQLIEKGVRLCHDRWLAGTAT